jgi:hypothetical protein
MDIGQSPVMLALRKEKIALVEQFDIAIERLAEARRRLANHQS